MSQKAVFVTNVPAPYRVAMLNRVSQELARHGVNLKVLFWAAGYRRRLYWEGAINAAKFDYRILADRTLLVGREKLVSIGTSLPAILSEEQPTVVISAGFSLPSVFAARYCSKGNIPFVIYSGETERQAKRRRGEIIRRHVRKRLLARSTCCIAYGTESRKFLESYGVAPARIFTSINSIDTDAFRLLLQTAAVSTAESPTMLYVGNLHPLKGLRYALKALHIVQASGTDLRFDVVGGGPDGDRLKVLAKQLSLGNVHFWGPMSNQDVVKFYARSSFFVFPSLYDIFGLVMVEAATSGLPIIASRLAGGTVDVVQDSINGYVVNPEDVDTMAQRMTLLSRDVAQREMMGKASLQLIAQSINIQESGRGFARGILGALGRTELEGQSHSTQGRA